jgi:hypothetical protein
MQVVEGRNALRVLSADLAIDHRFIIGEGQKSGCDDMEAPRHLPVRSG